MNLKDEIKRRIKIFEQSNKVATEPYLCPKNKWTIGWGYNYQDRGFSTSVLTEILQNGFSAAIAEKLLDADIDMVIKQCTKEFAWFAALDDVRKATIVDMCYQMGLETLKTFSNTLKAVGKGYYTVAADEMYKSLWRDQSGSRAIINIDQMRTGKWGAI